MDKEEKVYTLEKSPKSLKTSRWNKKIEKVVRDIGNKAFKYKSLHLKVAQKSYSKYSLYMSSVIILSPLAGTIGALGAFVKLEGYIFSITSSLISFICGILVSMIKFGKYDQMSNAHKTATARYISLGNNVKRQLSLYREDRISANEYLDWLTHSFDELYVSSPLLTNIKEFENMEDEILQESTSDTDDDYEIDCHKNCEKKEEKEFNKKNKKNKKNKNKLKLEFGKEEKEEDKEEEDKEEEDKEEVKNDYSFLLRQDLNKYDDGQMKYQLNRLNNII
jgi:hypothetical protein